MEVKVKTDFMKQDLYTLDFKGSKMILCEKEKEADKIELDINDIEHIYITVNEKGLINCSVEADSMLLEGSFNSGDDAAHFINYVKEFGFNEEISLVK